MQHIVNVKTKKKHKKITPINATDNYEADASWFGDRADRDEIAVSVHENIRGFSIYHLEHGLPMGYCARS